MRILRLFTNMFFLVFFFFICLTFDWYCVWLILCLTDIVCGRRMVIMRIRSPGVSLSTTVLTAPASLVRSSEYIQRGRQSVDKFVCLSSQLLFLLSICFTIVCLLVCLLSEDVGTFCSRYTTLCPNGTVFNQELFICDWWYKVKDWRIYKRFKIWREKFNKTSISPPLTRLHRWTVLLQRASTDWMTTLKHLQRWTTTKSRSHSYSNTIWLPRKVAVL